jgi:hypothetical protein
VPASSIGILVQGTNATAYSPLGSWGGCGTTTGVNVVPVETSAGIGKGGPPTTITTPNTVNSCSSNSITGMTVCTANNTDIYLITGTTLIKTLTSGATGFGSFSGGDCMNCGVVIDSSTNTAFLAVGLSGSNKGGYQALHLATETLSAPIASVTGISEDIAVDPIRKLILSPGESTTAGTLDTASYELVQTTPPNSVFDNQIVPIPTPTPAGAPTPTTLLDSAGEDCTTGIALSTDEGSGNLFITDLSQAKFTPGKPAGTWSAPSQFQNFPEFEHTIVTAGTSGLAVAPGSHLAIVTGEFGGNVQGVVQLPSTSGSGAPAFVDWVQFTVPNDPTGAVFSIGCDPHTVTAYLSPNTGKALGVLGNFGFTARAPTYLAIVDLAGMLKAKRTTEGHIVDPSVDLVKQGLVTFVAQ